MSAINKENLRPYLVAKKTNYSTTVTSQVKGVMKDKFLDDCIRRNIHEAEMLRVIIDAYYGACEGLPEINGLSCYEIKKFIVDRVRLPG